MSAPLSERVRPGVEAAPWVIEEIKWLEQALSARVPVQYLANGTRFKLSLDHAGKVNCFWNWKELDGRWVALVAAEDDRHLSASAPQPPAQETQEQTASALVRKVDAELEAHGLEPYTAVHTSRYRLLTAVRHFLAVATGYLPDWLLQPAQAMRDATEAAPQPPAQAAPGSFDGPFVSHVRFVAVESAEVLGHGGAGGVAHGAMKSPARSKCSHEWVTNGLGEKRCMHCGESNGVAAPQPPAQREWVGLTDEERDRWVTDRMQAGSGWALDHVLRDYESLLRGRNGAGK